MTGGDTHHYTTEELSALDSGLMGYIMGNAPSHFKVNYVLTVTAKPIHFSHNVGTIYRGFLTGNFYHYTLTISFCLRVSMVRMDKNWNLNILYNSHSLLFNSWIIKNDLQKMTLSFSFNIIIWYPFFRVWDMNKDNWEYWVLNSYSATGLVLLPATRGWRERGVDWNFCQKTRCSHIL